jgi:putative ABC transport system substrate-binding protein
MNDRRKLLVALGAGALSVPFGCFAQTPAAGMHRIGFLGLSSAAALGNRLDALRTGLRELGYVEGKNLAIEYRFAEGTYERLPELAAELVRLKVDVIVTHAAPGTRAAKQATATIPIVIATTGDVLVTGLVASLARPGGNVTGSTFFQLELGGKQLEMLKEAIPRIKRVAFLMNPYSELAAPILQAMGVAAKALKLEVQRFEVWSPDQFDSVLAAMSKQRIDAVVVHDDPMLIANAKAVASQAARYRIPSTGFVDLAEAGGLMAYGVSFPAMFRRAAVFVDKILKGAKPGDLPIERATTFELIVNLKTAKALGLTLPQSILLRADKVIE